MKIPFLVIICFSFFMQSYAQIYVDKSIILNGNSSANRQIENLTEPALSDGILTASAIQKNNGRFGVSSGTDSLIISTASGISAYVEGMIFYFKATSNNTKAVHVSINQLPFFSLKLFGTDELKKNQLLAGQIYCIIFSGAGFQLLSPVNNVCRTNFIEVNNHLCIELDERPAAELWDAMKTCNDNNTRLCRWGEWYYACQKAGLGLQNMTNNNWEWTDDAANATVRIAGSNGCANLQVSNINATTLRPYRCCYNK